LSLTLIVPDSVGIGDFEVVWRRTAQDPESFGVAQRDMQGDLGIMDVTRVDSAGATSGTAIITAAMIRCVFL
jgi:hypothetical protein